MSSPPVLISGSGAICSVGIGVPQIAASVRAGISRFGESSIYDRRFEPVRMALIRRMRWGRSCRPSKPRI